MSTSDSNGVTKRPFPFVGADLPFDTPRANAVYVTRELVSTYLITHPHLDHLSGLVINTASFTQTKCPKRIASLPTTIEAIKTHIFNDVIWPNLSDEGCGVGLVTYQRLPIAASEYVEVSKGLSVQAWPISHGHCMNTHSHRGSISAGAERSPGGTIKRMCVYDSAVFFIRDEATKQEAMMWGDVEPDSLSLSPRNHPAWDEAATKFHQGLLSTIFIECSYDCCQPDRALYGHLNPPHLLEELKVLAGRVVALRAQEERDRRNHRKRKRMSQGYMGDLDLTPKRSMNINHFEGFLQGEGNQYQWSQENSIIVEANSNGGGIWNSDANSNRRISKSSKQSGTNTPDPSKIMEFDQDYLLPQLSPKSLGNRNNGVDTVSIAVGQRTPEEVTPLLKQHLPSSAIISAGILGHEPLKGLHLVITHVKDTLQDDVDVAANILRSLERLEREQMLGCTFSLSEQGGTFYF
ncbi:cAMP phosphodiesterases class-II-domain-containing protein [Morchella snyderi]|nr:cAMP phosphodiesterases class-II-domain-containing protein [Morchella snyderi]